MHFLGYEADQYHRNLFTVRKANKIIQPSIFCEIAALYRRNQPNRNVFVQLWSYAFNTQGHRKSAMAPLSLLLRRKPPRSLTLWKRVRRTRRTSLHLHHKWNRKIPSSCISNCTRQRSNRVDVACNWRYVLTGKSDMRANLLLTLLCTLINLSFQSFNSWG